MVLAVPYSPAAGDAYNFRHEAGSFRADREACHSDLVVRMGTMQRILRITLVSAPFSICNAALAFFLHLHKRDFIDNLPRLSL